MEINTHSPQPLTSPANSISQQRDKDQVQQTNVDSSNSTVELSKTSQLLSQSTNTTPSSRISNTQAQQAVKQVQANANDNPTLTFLAQSHKVTSELVANLIG